MSFMKYLENKSKTSNIIIVTDEYEEKLHADISSLVLKPDHKIVEAIKNIINTKELNEVLSEISYPRSNELEMAISTGDTKKINRAYENFRHWACDFSSNVNLSNKIESMILQYQTKLYQKDFGPEEVDEVTKSFLLESKSILENMSHSINLAISKISNWNNHKIIIEAIYPKTGWMVLESKVTIGDAFTMSFFYECTPTGFDIKLIKEEKEIPESLKDNIYDLILKLKNNPKYNNILTLYTTRPISERHYFDVAKKDLSLGIEAVLPNHVTLTNSPLFGDSDIWKVRIEEKYIKEFSHDGNKKYQIIGKEAPIRWIERINQ
jgi:hypothetical protein